MPQVIRLKRSAVANKVPAVGDINLGEIAINTHDGRLYIKQDDGVEKVIAVNRSETGGRQWDSTLDYKIGDIVSYNNDGKLYIAISDHQGSDPSWLIAWYEFNTPRYNVGMWTPSAGNEYPDTFGLDPGAVWYIDGLPPYAAPPSPQGGYEMLTGPFAGIIVSNNDRFVWYGKNTLGTDIWLHEPAPDLVIEKGGVAFNSSVFYIAGDNVTYNGEQYIAPGNVSPGPWDVSQWSPSYNEKGGIAFDPTIQYESGDIISYGGVVYIAPTPAPVAGVAPGDPGWPLISTERGGIMWTAGQSYAIGDSVWDQVGTEPAAMYVCVVIHNATTGNGANGSPQQPAAANWTAGINEDPGSFF